jgi:hypothetical protein
MDTFLALITLYRNYLYNHVHLITLGLVYIGPSFIVWNFLKIRKVHRQFVKNADMLPIFTRMGVSP